MPPLARGFAVTPLIYRVCLGGNFGAFLPWPMWSGEKKDKENLDEKDKEKLKKLNVDRTWTSWLPGYLIYLGILAKANP